MSRLFRRTINLLSKCRHAGVRAIRARFIVPCPFEHRFEHCKAWSVNASFNAEILPDPAKKEPLAPYKRRRIEPDDDVRMTHPFEEAAPSRIFHNKIRLRQNRRKQRVPFFDGPFFVAPQTARLRCVHGFIQMKAGNTRLRRHAPRQR